MNDVDLSLETAARSGWALHELPARHTVRTDREVAVACATLAARLLQRGAVARSERGEAPVTASRIAVGTAHRDQSQAVRAILRDEGITGVTVDTANSLQGREFDVTIVWHPLSSRRDATAFHLESGRLCVLVSRHRHACIVVARAGIPELLDAHPSAEPVYLNVPVKFPDGWEAHQALMAHLAGVRELVLAKIQHFELSPEMSPDSDGGHRAECACGLAWRRVDKSDWRAFASLLDRESQVGVVGDHQSGIDMVTEYIQEQVRRNVDVAAFLLAMGDRNHEACVADSRAHPVLDHNRPLGGDQSRTAVGFAHRQWGGFDTRDVVAELDVIDASGQSARSPMSVAAKPRMSSHRQPGVPRPHVERPP